jgi:tetratricopeptide (TPR) repeat protein
LIQLLLSHQQFDRALSELLTLDGDLPDSAESHVQAGQLFLQANDPQHALKDFEIALKLDSHDPAALAGAGDAYFELETAVGQGNESGDVQEKLSLVKLIFSLDPLGPKLSARERQQRLKAGYQQAMQRLQTCLGQRLTNEQTTNLQNLATEAVSTQPQFQLRNIERDPDVVRSGLETIYRIETATNAACGKAPESDQALLLIASRHDGRQ